MDNGTTIRLSKRGKALLDETGKKVGQFGDTYEDIIIKLIEFYNTHPKKKTHNGDN